MARPRPAERDKPPVTTTSLIASAVRLPVVRPNAVRNGEGWQTAAWGYYDRIGELRFVANWVGNILSRAELHAVKTDGRTDTELESGPVADILSSYFAGEQGQAEMLRQTGIHLTIAGECYHVFLAEPERWLVLAAGKVKQNGERLQAELGDGEIVQLSPDDLAIRLWNPHPLNPTLADSPTRSNLSTLAEIERCNLHIQATLTSRLAGAGILFVPQDITFPVPDGADPASSTADVFMSVLGETMMTPIDNPGDPSAVVPIVVTAPGESLSQIRHVTFWTDVDDNIRDLRDGAVKRFALGMDIPPEVLLGLADTNHWNAWLVDEASVKAHTEPRLAVVANAITTAYLRPALEEGTLNPTDYGVIGDTSSIRLRPNRSKEAIELWDRGELTADALRRETGFEPEDAPDKHQFQEWLLRKIALGSTSPEQTQAALVALGSPVIVHPDDLGATQPDRADGMDNRRSLDDHPVTGPPAQPPPDDSLLAACDVLVYRALERAGNRLKSATNFTARVAAADIYLSVQAKPSSVDMLMTDAWSCADRVLAHHATSIEPLVACLDQYTRYLIGAQVPHSRDLLAQALAVSALVAS